MAFQVVDEHGHKHLLADENFVDPVNPTLDEVVNATHVVVSHTENGKLPNGEVVQVVVDEVKEADVTVKAERPRSRKAKASA